MKENLVVHVRGALWLGNFGDVLLAKIACRIIKRANPSAHIVLPGIPSRVLAEIGVSRESTTTDPGQPDLLVFCGGGYFSQRSHAPFRWSLRLIYRVLRHAIEARIKSIPYCFVGVGAGPLTQAPARQLLAYAAKGAEIVGVRDQASYDFFVEIGVRKEKIILGADMVVEDLSEPKAPGTPETRRGKVLGLHLTTFPEPVVEGIRKELLNRAGLTIKLFLDQRGAHMDGVAEQAKRIFGDMLEVVHYHNSDALIESIREMDGVITTKLHVGIVASSLGKSVVAFPWHHKVARFYDEIAAPSRCLPAYSVVTEAEVEKILSKYFPRDAPWPPVEIPESVRLRSRVSHDVLMDFICEH